MAKLLRVLIIADPGLPVPPHGYGGIERVVGLLAQEYYKNGHNVTILASKGSMVEGCTIYSNGNQGFPQSKLSRFLTLLKTWLFLLLNYKSFDVVQNFGRLIYLLPILNSNIKKIMCYQRKISVNNIKWLLKLPQKNIKLSGCSNNLVSDLNLKGKWHVVYNPINSFFYQLNHSNHHKKPLIFLSRINSEKGCHIAIEVAKKSNNVLLIAGNYAIEGEEGKYFKNIVQPQIDGKQIIYVGELNDTQKNHYLGNAKAMLFPILWDEPFGIVMIESMTCGTPVIAFNRGSVGEVVDEGITGYKVDNEDDMIRAVYKINLIDRVMCRNHAKNRFDIELIASQYLSLN
jgi:glycosyltransferase involved in cell wall biosynthesis